MGEGEVGGGVCAVCPEAGGTDGESEATAGSATRAGLEREMNWERLRALAENGRRMVDTLDLADGVVRLLYEKRVLILEEIVFLQDLILATYSPGEISEMCRARVVELRAVLPARREV